MNFIMIGLLLREELDRLRVPLNMYLVVTKIAMMRQMRSSRIYNLANQLPWPVHHGIYDARVVLSASSFVK